jgi:hypothetical protein
MNRGPALDMWDAPLCAAGQSHGLHPWQITHEVHQECGNTRQSRHRMGAGHDACMGRNDE